MQFHDLFSTGRIQADCRSKLCFVSFSSIEVCCLGKEDICFKKKKKAFDEGGSEIKKKYCGRDWLLLKKGTQESKGDI